MARYNDNHQIRINNDVERFKLDLLRDVFAGAEVGTVVKVFGSGSTDPTTEEYTASANYSWIPISGMVHRLQMANELMGIGGRTVEGNAVVIYPYASISGIIEAKLIKEIGIFTSLLSGVYYAGKQTVTQLGDENILLQIELHLDRNG